MVAEVINVIRNEVGDNRIQMFSTANTVGDSMDILWVNPEDRSNYVAVCWGWGYIDAVGFSDEDYKQIFEACGY